METIQTNLSLLLDGGKPYEEQYDFCDFSLSDQNEASLAKGVTPSVPADFKPVIKQSVTYIVAAVLINERGEVLMMQEAKSSCAGQWYLPAGRMEPGEDVVEAVKREVLEETGLHFDVTTLLAVECAGGSWYRFVVTGQVTGGGKLKTPADADSESLQAKWISDLSELSLRANDVLPIIERGKQYYAATKERDHSSLWHSAQLPALRPHHRLLLRLVVAVRKKSNNRVHVLVSEKTAAHLPVCEINPTRSVHATLKKFMTEIFGSDLPQHRPHGLLSVEHSGKPAQSNDGCCLTLLVSIRIALEDVCLIDKPPAGPRKSARLETARLARQQSHGYSWLELDQGIGEDLLARLGKNLTIPMTVIR